MMLLILTSTWSDFGEEDSINLMSSWNWPVEKVSWFSMISCSVTAPTQPLPSSWKMWRRKWNNRLEELGITPVWLCGLEITKFYKDSKTGDLMVSKNIVFFSKNLFLRSLKFNLLISRISPVLLFMGLEIVDLNEEEISIIGESGQVECHLNPMKEQWDLSTVNLELKHCLFGTQ